MDSNQRIKESKSFALPLGDTPICFFASTKHRESAAFFAQLDYYNIMGRKCQGVKKIIVRQIFSSIAEGWTFFVAAVSDAEPRFEKSCKSQRFVLY